MGETLSEVLQDNFERIHCVDTFYPTSSAEVKPKYMTIFIDKDKFEVPTFALYALNKISALFGSIVAKLRYVGTNSRYKTINASLRNGLSYNYKNIFLYKLPSVGDPERTYYVTQGCIFDEELNPIMVLTWEIEREPHKDLPKTFMYSFIKPVLRVVPEVVIYKANALERYIVNKIIPTVLNSPYISSPRIGNELFKEGCIDKPKVIIDSIPFTVKSTSTPSISTTNEELMKVALDNLEELA